MGLEHSGGENCSTRLIVGLGNPGSKYDGTRHNIGFQVIRELSKRLFAESPRAKFDGEYSVANVGGTRAYLLCPLTYMNSSGHCVGRVVDFFKINYETHLLVICDDMSLPLGKLRVRAKGSAGGQNGLKDILRVLSTDSIARLRVGIDGPPPGWEASDFVLGRFRKDELPFAKQAASDAADAALDWLENGVAHCMNKFN